MEPSCGKSPFSSAQRFPSEGAGIVFLVKALFLTGFHQATRKRLLLEEVDLVNGEG